MADTRKEFNENRNSGNRKERIVDLRQYILYLIEKCWIIILIAVICAGCLGYKNYKSQKASIAGNRRGAVNTIISDNRNSYYGNAKKFTDANIPGGVVNSYVKLYVDLNYDFLSDNTIDINSGHTKLGNDVSLLVSSVDSMQEIMDELSLDKVPEFAGLKAYDLTWLINKNFMGTHVVNIVVSDIDAARAQKIAEAVADKFIEKAVEYGLAKSVKYIDHASLPNGSYFATRVDRNAFLKECIIGGVAGALLSMVLLLITFIVKDCVRTDIDAEYAGTEIIGFVPKKKDRQLESIRRIAVKLEAGEARIITIAPADKKADISTLVEGLSSALSDFGRKVEIISETPAEGVVEKASAKSDYVLIPVKNVKESADAEVAAIFSDSVILAAGYGKTSVKNLSYSVKELLDAGKPARGVIITDKMF